MKVWLDDWRMSPAGWMVARTAADAIRAFADGDVDEISLDYDLGTGDVTGLNVAKWIRQGAEAGTLPRIRWHLHSDNNEGREKILRVMEEADRHWLENEMTEQEPFFAPGELDEDQNPKEGR